MITISSVYRHPLGGSDVQEELGRFSKEGHEGLKHFWDKNPVTLHTEDKQPVPIEEGIAFLKNELHSLVEMAGIQEHQIRSGLLKQIHNRFKVEIAAYNKSFIKATAEDHSEWQSCKKTYAIKDTYPTFLEEIFAWLGCLGNDHPSKKCMSRETFELKTQLSRRAWFTGISTSEKCRREYICSSLEQDLLRLHLSLERNRRLDKNDMDLEMAAWQVAKVYSVLAPQEENADAHAIQQILPADSTMEERLASLPGPENNDALQGHSITW
ncbi:MAG: hypothetical protein JSR46_06375 [Verrucomicrobia bacterium]|nr:hypothetical protein [Verrucomicrobiota bacterium]